MENRLSKLISTKAENLIDKSEVDFNFLSQSKLFPLVIEPKHNGLILTEWIKKNKEVLDQKVRIHGAVLFRGFQINTVERFQTFIDVFDAIPLEYRQRSSPRFEVAKNIYHSTTYPADQSINMHSENSYLFRWAMKIVFCCLRPAEEQGETPIADNRMVLKYLSPATREKFLNTGVRYVRNISKGLGLSWQEVFQTEERKNVEEECKRDGIDFRWVPNEKLILSWNNKAIYNHPETNEELWFNHAFFFNKYTLTEEMRQAFETDDELPFSTCFGDGTEISKEQIEEIRKAYEKSTFIFKWEKGDTLFMDNMLISHGRRPYKGDRKIIVAMF